MFEGSAAIFVGSTMGDTMEAAERLADKLGKLLGKEVGLFDVESTELARLEEFDLLLIGCPTWNIGELQVAWRIRFDELGSVDLRGKLATFFGSGDQVFYPDTFQDAMGILADKFEERGARLIGYVAADGYDHTASLAQRGDSFVGLPLDYENEPDESAARIDVWVESLVEELAALADPVLEY